MPKYRIEKLRDDGSWSIYRDGQTFNSPTTAHRLLNRLMDRYGEDRIRLAIVRPTKREAERLDDENKQKRRTAMHWPQTIRS